MTHPLNRQRYVSLTTFRRDGTPVATPVWLVEYEAGIAVWTGAGTGKVKRIRRNPEVTVAPCTFRGRLIGAPVSGRATVLPDAETAGIIQLIKKKYRLQGWLVTRRAVRRPGSTVAIAIALPLGSEAPGTAPGAQH